MAPALSSHIGRSASGLGTKRQNAGTKKSPLQIQMLERFYTGKHFELHFFTDSVLRKVFTAKDMDM